MILKLVRTPGIYLVGFMGTGKSTIGQLLADRLGWTFIDLDCDIESAQKMPIGEIFDRHGEDHFRRIETEALRRRLRQVRGGRPTILALGGGAFARPENYEMLAENGVTVWLDCPLETAWQRVQQNAARPLARDRARFEALYERRRPQYARADFRVETDCEDPRQAVDAICRLPIF